MPNHGENDYNTTTMMHSMDYNALANQALALLEEDYRRTIEAQTSTNTNTSMDQVIPEIDPDTLQALPPIQLIHEEEFVADFSQNKNQQDSSSSSTDKLLASPRNDTVDTEAVRKAVQAIQLKNSKLVQGFQQWETNSKLCGEISPNHHTIIPSTPLSAFRKRSDKARQATANLSRSATIAEAVHRLNILAKQQSLLRIHVIGCDAVECSTDEQSRTFFSPLVRWLGAASPHLERIECHFIGPCIPQNRDRIQVDLMPSTNNPTRSNLKNSFAKNFVEPYEQYLDRHQEEPSPDLVIAFNAGIWGYDSWKPALRKLSEKGQGLVLVTTAYTIQECEDDHETLQSTIRKEDMEEIWGPELNAYGSRMERPTLSVKGRQYRENAAWQAVRFVSKINS